MRLFLILCMLISLAGCGKNPFITNGGSTSFSEEKTTTTIPVLPSKPIPPTITDNPEVDKVNAEIYTHKVEEYNKAKNLPENQPQVITEKREVVVTPPDNAKDNSQVTIERDPDGYLKIKTNTSGSYDPSSLAAIDAKFKALNPLIYLGAGLIVVGVIILVKLNDLKFGGASICTGILFIILSVVVAEYTAYFLIFGTLLAIGAAIYFILKYNLLSTSNKENIGIIQAIKPDLPDDKREKWFTGKIPMAQIMQSPSTMKIVRDVKIKEKI